MTVDRASRPYRVVVVAPGETVSTGLDVSEIVVGFDGGWNAIDQSGIISFTGDLTLQGFPLADLGINTNPRRDRLRWARGNRVIIWLADSTGNLVRFLTTHILKDPLPPSPRTNPNLTLSLGDKLTFLSFRTPPGDKSGVPIGGSNTRKNVIDNLLIASGAGMSFGGITGDINVPLQKLTNQSYIQQAGQMAFAGSRFLWVDAMGTVRLSAIDLDGAADVNLTIGRDEISYEPIEGSETPAEVVKATGKKYSAIVTPDSTTTEKEAWGLAAVVDPNASGKTILSIETVKEFWSNNTRVIETDRIEARGLVFPDIRDRRLGLVPSLKQTEKYIYENGREGKLLKVERSIWRPYAVALRDYFANLDPEDQAANRTTLIEAEDTEIDYDYKKDVTSSISSTTKEPIGAVLPNEDLTGAISLTPTSSEIQSWEKQYRNSYLYTKETYGAAAREFPDAIAAMPPETPISAKLGLLLTEKETKTSNSGQTTPPAAERRKPKVTIEESAIEGVAEFKPYAGSEFQARERMYNVPYADEQELEAIAKLLGRLLIGRRMGQAIAFALSDWWLSNRPPIARSAITEPDGRIEKFLLNGIAIAFDDRDCYLSADGIWLGSIEGIGLGQTVRPPLLMVASSTGGLGLGGGAIAYPYPLENPIAIASGSFGRGGDLIVFAPMQKGEGAIGLGGNLDVGRPFAYGVGAIGLGGRTIDIFLAGGAIGLGGSGGIPDPVPVFAVWGSFGMGGNLEAETPYRNVGGFGLSGNGGIPAQFATNGLTRYLIATSGVTRDAIGKVMVWRDSEGVNDSIAALAGVEPLYVASAINGRPAIRFDRSIGTYLSSADASPIKTTGDYITATAMTGFVIIKPSSIANSSSTAYANDTIVQSSSAWWGLHLKSTPAIIATIYGGGEVEVALPNLNAVLITWWHANGMLSLQVNQGTVATVPLTNNIAEQGITDYLHISDRAAGYSGGFSGELGAIAIYNRALSLQERSLMQTALLNQFGL